MDNLLKQLKALAEPTRLRIMALCASADLTVSDLTQLLGQSQPRLSRHLKLLTDAGLLRRQPEGAFVYFGLTRDESLLGLLQNLLGQWPESELRRQQDRQALHHLQQERREQAEQFFRSKAPEWDKIRALHVPEAEIEQALRHYISQSSHQQILDIGVGTGRLLELFASDCQAAIGVDISRAMLELARQKLVGARFAHCDIRHGDMYALPIATASQDVAMLYMVLRYAEHPSRAIAEAARVLRPSGQLLVVDFAPHRRDEFRRLYHHRHLGIAAEDLAAWANAAGLVIAQQQSWPGSELTVCLWQLMPKEAATTPTKDIAA